MALSVGIPWLRPDVARIDLAGPSNGPSGNPWQLITMGTRWPQAAQGYSAQVYRAVEDDLTLSTPLTDLSFVVNYDLFKDFGYFYVEAWTASTGPHFLEFDIGTADDPFGMNSYGNAPITDRSGTGPNGAWVTATITPASIAAVAGDIVEYYISVDNSFHVAQGVAIDSITENGVEYDFAGGDFAGWDEDGTEFYGVDVTDTTIFELNDYYVATSGLNHVHPLDDVFRLRWRVHAGSSRLGVTGGAGTTQATATAPSGLASGDLEFIFCESSDSTTAAGTPNTPTGFTKIFEETQASGATGVTTLTIFARLNTGTIGSVTVDGVGDHIIIRRTAYRDHNVSDVTTDIDIGTGNGADTGDATWLGITPSNDNSIILAVACSTRDSTTSSFGAVSNSTLPGFNERADAGTTNGAGGIIFFSESHMVNAGATGNCSATIAVSDKWRAVLLAFEASVTTTWKQQYRLTPGSGSWLDVTGSTPLQIASSAAFATDDVTTAIQGSALFAQESGGKADESDNSIPLTLVAGYLAELEFAVMLDSDQLDNGDVIEIRLSDDAGNTSSTLIQIELNVGEIDYEGWTFGRAAAFDVAYTIGNGGEWCTGTYDDKMWAIFQISDSFDGHHIVSYDPVANVWEHWDDVDTTEFPSGEIIQGQRTIYGGKIYVTNWLNTSFDAQQSLKIYDIATRTWTDGADPPDITGIDPTGTTNGCREEGGSVAHNGFVYVFGGVGDYIVGNVKSVQEVHIYDIADDSWTVGAAHGEGDDAMEFADGVVVNGKIYVVHQDYTITAPDEWSAVSAYDIADDSWESIPVSLPSTDFHWETATPLHDPSDDTIIIVNQDPVNIGTFDFLPTIRFDPVTEAFTEADAQVPCLMTYDDWYDYLFEGWNEGSSITRVVWETFKTRDNGPGGEFVFRGGHAVVGGLMVYMNTYDNPVMFDTGGVDEDDPYWD